MGLTGNLCIYIDYIQALFYAHQFFDLLHNLVTWHDNNNIGEEAEEKEEQWTTIRQAEGRQEQEWRQDPKTCS